MASKTLQLVEVPWVYSLQHIPPFPAGQQYSPKGPSRHVQQLSHVQPVAATGEEPRRKRKRHPIPAKTEILSPALRIEIPPFQVSATESRLALFTINVNTQDLY